MFCPFTVTTISCLSVQCSVLSVLSDWVAAISQFYDDGAVAIGWSPQRRRKQKSIFIFMSELNFTVGREMRNTEIKIVALIAEVYRVRNSNHSEERQGGWSIHQTTVSSQPVEDWSRGKMKHYQQCTTLPNVSVIAGKNVLEPKMTDADLRLSRHTNGCDAILSASLVRSLNPNLPGVSHLSHEGGILHNVRI